MCRLGICRVGGVFSYLADRLFWLLCHDVTILFDMWDLIYLTLAGYYLI